MHINGDACPNFLHHHVYLSFCSRVGFFIFLALADVWLKSHNEQRAVCVCCRAGVVSGGSMEARHDGVCSSHCLGTAPELSRRV